MLIYIVDVLKGRIDSKALYSKNQVSIPWPEFYVLYNGKEEFPDTSIYKLSDLFEKTEDLNLPKKTHALDLEVKIININEGRNKVIAAKCKKLAEYSAFISKARSYVQEFNGDKEKAVKEAIKYCASHDILKEFLEIHGRRVLNMLLTEWNTEDAIAYAREETREETREEEREYFISLLDQGLSIEEIKQRLNDSSLKSSEAVM